MINAWAAEAIDEDGDVVWIDVKRSEQEAIDMTRETGGSVIPIDNFDWDDAETPFDENKTVTELAMQHQPTIRDIFIEKRIVRQILEREIDSYAKAAKRHAEDGAFDAASMDNMIRQGISHALFVLGVECDV